MKTIKIILISIVSTLLIILTLVSSFVIAGVTTPNLLSFFLRIAWQDTNLYLPEEYELIKDDIEVVKDFKYKSQYSENYFDIYFDKTSNNKQTTILWIHGGGFVSGSKEGIKVFASLLAKEGYTFISMNYELAPESTYPKPLIQVSEAILALKNLEFTYNVIDTNNLVIGGDSAGAHVAANFATLETNIKVQKILDLKPVMDNEIKGLLLYCGPYDLMKFDNLLGGESKIINYFVDQIGWSYFGFKNWRNSKIIEATNIVDLVNDKFPTTYLTDGNQFSFMDHALELEGVLSSNNISYNSYYPSNFYESDFVHEYQFDFENYYDAVIDNLTKTLEFLNKL